MSIMNIRWLPTLCLPLKNLLTLTVTVCTVGLLASRALALCAGALEDGLWQNLNGDDPARVKIDQANCEVPGGSPFSVTVWVRQASGALYQRGVFAGSYQTASDGSQWIYAQYGVGGYFAHQWVREYTFSDQRYLRVWIYWESLDSKPSATSDSWFKQTISQPGNPYSEWRNRQAGMCLDADLGSADQDGGRVQTFACWDALNQNWYFNTDGTIVNLHSGKCLDADLGTITQDGTKVQLWSCWGGLNQRWTRNPDGTLTNAQSGRCLDADLDGIGSNGDTVQLWTCWGGENQQWEGE
jgi:Ricin-type beta-trefoil lectin domain